MREENNSSSIPHFRSDQPITDPARDAYSRRPFAEGLAKSITSLPRDECYVIGLHGPWGDGKTSVLRFVEHTLKGDSATVVVWFNPWRFLHEEAILGEFFDVLAARVEARLTVWHERLARVGSWVSRVAGVFYDQATKVAEIAAEKAEANIEKKRQRLKSALEQSGKRLVVFIDDIDRLDSSEIASLFRLIKACADLPNVVYVLAFDREMVARTVGTRLVDGDAEAGRNFLEKIIQIPVALPPASRRDLDRACMTGVEEVLRGVGLKLTGAEELRWQWAYQDGIARRLRTPRQVAQYLNAVRFAMPLLAGEVNTVDLLLAEALRVCYAPAYETIRANQSTFIGVPIGDLERRLGGSPQDDLLEQAKRGMEKADIEALDRLIERMFPRYHVSRKGLVLVYQSTEPWTRDRLICSPAYGPRYFAYAIGSSDVADADIEAMLDAAASDNSTRLRTLLDKHLEAIRQAMLVFKLHERLETIPGPSASRIATMLASLSDRFEEPFSLQDSNHPGIAAATLAVKLCLRFGEDAQRLQASKALLANSQEMWFAAAYMRKVDQLQVDQSKKVTPLSDESLKLVRTAFLARYESHARKGEPQLDLERRWKFETLFSVARAGGRELVHDQFVPKMRDNGNVAIRMFQLLAQPLARSGEIIPTPGDFGPEDLETLALLVDVDEAAKVVQHWVREDLRKDPAEFAAMKPDDRVLAQFWHVYQQSKSQGQSRNPS